MVVDELRSFRDETLDVVNPTKAASPSTERALRNVPLVGGPIIGSDLAKGYSNTVSPGENVPVFERIGGDYRETGIVAKATGDASDAFSNVTPDLPDERTVQKYGLVIGGFLLVFAALSSTSFNVGGGR